LPLIAGIPGQERGRRGANFNPGGSGSGLIRRLARPWWRRLLRRSAWKRTQSGAQPLEATSKPVATIPVGTDVHEAIGWCVIAGRHAGMSEARLDRFIKQAVEAADDDGESEAWRVARSSPAPTQAPAVEHKINEQIRYVNRASLWRLCFHGRLGRPCFHIWRDGVVQVGGDRKSKFRNCNSDPALPDADPGAVIIHRWRKRAIVFAGRRVRTDCQRISRLTA
jgi:hypothetical protein